MEKIKVDVRRYRGPIRNWWVSLVLGILFLAMGVVVIIYSKESYVTLSLLFGIGVMVAGLLEIYLGASMEARSGRGWIIATGVIELLLGVMLVALPVVSMAMLPFLLGFWLLFRGFSLIGLSSDMMAWGIKGPGWVLAIAIMLVICAFLVIFHPVIGAGAIVAFLGIGLLLLGVDMIVFALYLNRLRKDLM